MATLKEKLYEKIQEHRPRTTRLLKEHGDTKVGEVTSGAFGPSLEAPMSMGYVTTEHSQTGTKLEGEVRGKRMPVTVADLPFRPSNYKR